MPPQKRSDERGLGATMSALPLQVWVTVSLDKASNKLSFGGGSDSELSAGVVAVLADALSGLTPEEVLQVCASTRAHVRVYAHACALEFACMQVWLMLCCKASDPSHHFHMTPHITVT